MLLKRLDINVKDVPELVAACCTLHNVCEVHGDTIDEDWLELRTSAIQIHLMVVHLN